MGENCISIYKLDTDVYILLHYGTVETEFFSSKSIYNGYHHLAIKHVFQQYVKYLPMTAFIICISLDISLVDRDGECETHLK